MRDLAGGRRYGIAGRLPELRQAHVRHAVAAPPRRHGLRAGRRARQQAPPRHGVRPHALQRQGVHGFGHAALARRRLDRDGAHRCSAPTSSSNNCVIIGNVNVNSPLVWDSDHDRRDAALRRGQSGAGRRAVHPRRGDGPGHHAGAVAQAHAETLVGVALGQLVRPGSPAIYGNFLSSMALRSRQPDVRHAGAGARFARRRPAGAPGRAAAALLRRVHVVEDRRRPGDGESAVSMMSAMLCGANFILHSAGWLEGGLAMGYEKFMMDARLVRRRAHLAQGRSTSTTTSSRSTASRDRAGQALLLGAAHAAPLRDRVLRSPPPTTRHLRAVARRGRARSEERAAALVAKTLAEYEPPPIDEAVDAALLDFIDRRKLRCPISGTDRLGRRQSRGAGREVEQADRRSCRSRAGAASRCRPRREPAARRGSPSSSRR